MKNDEVKQPLKVEATFDAVDLPLNENGEIDPSQLGHVNVKSLAIDPASLIELLQELLYMRWRNKQLSAKKKKLSAKCKRLQRKNRNLVRLHKRPFA